MCEAVGADIKDVALGMGYDTRIGHEFLKPGPGWGGSCFPKDTRAMVRIAEDAGYDFNLLKGVGHRQRRAAPPCRRQDRRPGGWLGAGQADRGVGPHVQGPHRRPARVAVAGGDRAPRGAGRRGARPSIRPAPGPLEGIEVVDDPYAAVEGAEVLAVLTEWDEFRWLDIDKVADLMAAKNVVDARNLLDRAALVTPRLRVRGHRPAVARRYVPRVLLSPRYDAPPIITVEVREPGSAPGRAAAPAARGSCWVSSATTSGRTPAAATHGRCRTSSPT